MKTCRALLLSFFVLANSAFANSFQTDMTDLWWNANESGWGVTATHQGDVVFLTFFVYGTDSRPTFYTASASYTGSTGQGALSFSGPMYLTSGPWFGALFDPNAVGVRQVGTATFTALIDTATLTYSVDGTVIGKSLTRQTFRANNLTGEYFGFLLGTNSGCSNPLYAGSGGTAADISIAHSGTSFSMIANDGKEICTYTGNYAQAGRMGRSQGTYSCPGRTGTYSLLELEANPSGLTGRITSSDTRCSQSTGRAALARKM